MQKKVSLLWLLVTTAAVPLVACQFQASAGPGTPQNPTGGTADPPATAAVPAPAPVAPSPRVASLRSHQKSRKIPRTGGVTPPGTTPPGPTPTAPGEPPVLTAANAFGSGDPQDANFLGSVYEIPDTTQKVPDLTPLKAAGTMFAKELNVAPRDFAGGFPGSTQRSTWFALRYEAPLVVETEADYDFTINSDDGSIVFIDDTKIVDNDGLHPAAAKTGPVHLVKGTHSLRVDYIQGSTPSVALQLWCNPMNGEKKVCTGKL